MKEGFQAYNSHEAPVRRTNTLLLIAAVLSLGAAACQSTGVGDPCVPEQEYDQNFAGYDVTQVYTESRSFQCESRLCLVNHFAGRVSCPYGQLANPSPATPEEANLADPSIDPKNRCYVPGAAADGNPQNLIAVAVPPQLLSRQTSDAVYCSCRCDGPDKGVRYCQCPSGYSCTELIPQGLVTAAGTGSGGGQLAGSYCIKAGTALTNAAQVASGSPCLLAGETCGPVHPDGIN